MKDGGQRERLTSQRVGEGGGGQKCLLSRRGAGGGRSQLEGGAGCGEEGDAGRGGGEGDM